MKKSQYYYDYTRNGMEETTKNIPSYYIGSNGYEARKVVEGFQPENYNIATALSYLMRAGSKLYIKNDSKLSMIEDINKAINHLNFELERLNNE